jgi:hypothetical protein
MSEPTRGTPATTDAALESTVLRVVCDRMCDSASVHVAWARRIAEAVAPLMAAREAAAYDRGRDEGRAEEADQHLAHLTAQTKSAGELRTEAGEILAGVDALHAEVVAAERRGAALVKGLRKAVKDPEVEWVDASIIRLLLARATAVADPEPAP